MEYKIGQIVYSKSGRDKGMAFVVLSVEGCYLYLVDGKCRKLEKPKRKKIIHIQPTRYVDRALSEKLEQNAYVLNADVKKTLQSYKTETSKY